MRKWISFLLILTIFGVSLSPAGTPRVKAASQEESETAGPVSEVKSTKFNTSDIQYSGNIGNMKWGIDGSGVFAFYHSDKTPEKAIRNVMGFPAFEARQELPWYRYRDMIRCVTLANPDSYIAVGSMDYFFDGCQNLEYVVYMPAAATSMRYTFAHCEKLTAIGCIMPTASNINFCFTGSKALSGDVLFASSPTSCKKAFTGTGCDVLVVPEIYNADSPLATESECSTYEKLGSYQLTLSGISRADGSLIPAYASDSYVSSIRYGQSISDAEVGSTGGLRLAYTHYGSRFFQSVYVPCSVNGVKSSNVEWNTVPDVGTHAGIMDITMVPAEQGTLGSIQPASFYGRPLRSLTVERCPVNECIFSFSGSSYTYDGSAKLPAVRLTNPYNNASLVKDTDFTVSYSNNINAGTASVTVRGKGRYSGSAVKSFTIAKADMTEQIHAAGYSGIYDGAPHSISVQAPTGATVKYGTVSGTYDRNDSPSYTNAGTYTVYYEVTKANHSTVTGSRTVVIKKADMTVRADAFRGRYDGNTHGISVSISKPSAGASVRYGTSAGAYNQSSSPVYKNAGTYTVYYEVTAPNYNTYTGSATVQITAKELAGCTITGTGAAIYNGSPHTPSPVVCDGSVILTRDTDYTVSYGNNVNAGTGSVIVTGKGNYTGRIEQTFSIAKTNMSVNVSGYNGTYDKAPHGIRVNVGTPASGAVIRYGTSAGTYSENTSPVFKNAGKHTVYYEVTAPNYNVYTGSADVEIAPRRIVDCTIREIGSERYNAAPHVPSVVVSDGDTALIKDIDFTISCSDNINVGTAVVTITGKGNYSGSVNKSFTITKAPMKVKSSGYTGIYDQTAHGISVSVQDPPQGAVIRYGMSREACNRNTSPTFEHVGTYTVYYEVTAANYNTYTGSEVVRITAKDVGDCFVDEIADETYDGKSHTPTPSVRDGSRILNPNTDYDVSFQNHINAGTAEVIISGKGDYAGSRSKSFVICPLQLQTAAEHADGFVRAENVIYTGLEKSPGLSVVLKEHSYVLKEGEDYIVKVNKGSDAGLGIVSISGKGNYVGELSVSYLITAVSMDGYGDALKLDREEHTYTGKEIHPELSIHDINGNLLAEGKDYHLIYEDAIHVGRAKVKAVFRGNYAGSISKSYYIRPAAVQQVELRETEFVYNGKEHMPAAKGFVPDVDYEVCYRDNVQAGKALAVFSFCGNYTGTITKEFEICRREIAEELVFPTASEISYAPGKTVSASKLSNLENEFGEFCWDDPNQEIIVQNDGYPVRFIPRDMKNYVWESVSGWNEKEKAIIRKISLPVNKAKGVLPPFRVSALTEGDPIGAAELEWEGEAGVFCWPDEQLPVSADIQNYRLKFIPADHNNYDWTNVGKWDEENGVCEITVSPVVIKNPVQTEEPAETKRPVITESPVRTERPIITEKPSVPTREPDQTEKPVITESPVKTERPVITEKPSVPTQAPVQHNASHQGEADPESVEGQQPSAYEIIDQYITARTQKNDRMQIRSYTGKVFSRDSVFSRKTSIRERWITKRKTVIRLSKGKKLRLRIKGVSPNKKLKWRSSKRKVVSINKQGILTVRKKGTVKITVRARKKNYTCVVKARR